MNHRILFEVGHPQDVHQFNQVYTDLAKLGWEGLFAAKEKDIVIDLLENLKLPYKIFAKTPDGLVKKIASIPKMDYSLFKLVKNFKPEIILSRVSAHSGHVSFFCRLPHIAFADTENVRMLDTIAVPFTDRIITSHSFRRSYGKKQIRYPGYIELWYLHPERFIPNPDIYNLLGLSPDEKFIILRFISWNAHHDIGFKGFDDSRKIEIVKNFSKYGKVFISSEKDLPAELQPNKIKIPVEWVHHALYYAELYYGESATMAAEAAVLGTPAIFLDHVGRGYTDDLEKRFNLVCNYSLSEEDQRKSIIKADEILNDPKQKEQSAINRKRMLSFCINPASFVTWYVQNYPERDKLLQNDPDLISTFQ